MGLRFRKSVKVAPGVKLNVGKKSVGMSVGGKGARVSASTSGRKTTTVGIPGSGVSYSHSSGGKGNKSNHSSAEYDENLFEDDNELDEFPSKPLGKLGAMFLTVIGIAIAIMGLLILIVNVVFGIIFILLGIALCRAGMNTLKELKNSLSETELQNDTPSESLSLESERLTSSIEVSEKPRRKNIDKA